MIRRLRPARAQRYVPPRPCRCTGLPAMRSRERRKPLPSSGEERLASEPPVPMPIDGTEVTRILLDRAGERPCLPAPPRAACRVGEMGARGTPRKPGCGPRGRNDRWKLRGTRAATTPAQ
jgi:hypothetical protein